MGSIRTAAIGLALATTLVACGSGGDGQPSAAECEEIKTATANLADEVAMAKRVVDLLDVSESEATLERQLESIFKDPREHAAELRKTASVYKASIKKIDDQTAIAVEFQDSDRVSEQGKAKDASSKSREIATDLDEKFRSDCDFDVELGSVIRETHPAAFETDLSS